MAAGSDLAGIEISPVTKGPIVNDEMMTSVPGIFAAGNVAAVLSGPPYGSGSLLLSGVPRIQENA